MGGFWSRVSGPGSSGRPPLGLEALRVDDDVGVGVAPGVELALPLPAPCVADVDACSAPAGRPLGLSIFSTSTVV